MTNCVLVSQSRTYCGYSHVDLQPWDSTALGGFFSHSIPPQINGPHKGLDKPLQVWRVLKRSFNCWNTGRRRKTKCLYSSPHGPFWFPFYSTLKQVKYTQRVPKSHQYSGSQKRMRRLHIVLHLFCYYSKKIQVASCYWFQNHIKIPLNWGCKDKYSPI